MKSLEHSLVRCLVAFLTVAGLTFVPAAAHAQIDVPMNRYDNARTGANLKETTLTAANVNVKQFGKLFSYPVDGAVYAQPLYLSGVSIQGKLRNVLYVATMNDKIYAFDADSASPTPLWMTDFTNPPWITAIPATDIVAISRNIYGNVGIESTPVIDRGHNKLYLVARTKENGTYVQRLHALDITTGQPVSGSPKTITASVPGSALDATLDASGNKVITFNPLMQQQRAALALTNGVVLVAWAGHEDKPPYHGWIMGFNATTLATVGVFAVVPDAYGGGIWQGGRAPTIDKDGNAYFATGNGKWNGTRNFGDSLLRFGVSANGMTLDNYFTPANEWTLNINDDDLSGSGFTLLPGTNLLLGGGKEGVLYLLDANNLGHQQTDDVQAQKIPVNGGHVMGGPVFWESPNDGSLVYNWSEDDVLVAYQLIDGKLTAPYRQGVVRSPGHPGGSLTISANGSAANSGIVWASIPTKDAKLVLAGGILRAFNAETLQEIWTSEQSAARDRVGTFIKFVPPVVANGKVYMATQDKGVAVYGLLPQDFNVSVSTPTVSIPAGSSATVSVAVAAFNGFAAPVNLSASGAPTGTTVTFNPPSIAGAGVSTMTITIPSGAASASYVLTVAGVSGGSMHTAMVAVTPIAIRDEIVLYAKDAQAIVGNWRKVADASAAGGARMENPDLGAPRLPQPLASPADYFEVAFSAKANVPYRLWLRGRAQNNSYNNDSVYIQFSGSVTNTGTPVNRIGTTEAVAVVLEDCTGCGVHGWGWQDNGYGVDVLGPPLYFTAGQQTMRIQTREDGISIDQIVLSPAAYMNKSPGVTKDDTTILPLPPPTTGTIVMYPALEATAHGTWRVVADTTAADGKRIELPDAGVPKIAPPLVDPVNYIELTFVAEANKPYRLWMRGKAQADSYNNDSVWVQFSGSVTRTGAPIYGIGTSQGVSMVLEDCTNCGVKDWGWQDNGYGVGVLGPELYFTAGPQTMRIQQREDGLSIDQLVLSPDTFLSAPPGPPKSDTTVLRKTQ
jgi:hypothetical protein